MLTEENNGNEPAYLSIIGLARRKQGGHRVITGDEETSEVHEELASNIEEDQEEVDANESEDSVYFGDGCLLLKVVESWVFG